MNVARFSVNNPAVVNVLMAALLLLGGMALVRLPREATSEVRFSWVILAVPFPGATAEHVEKSVTIPIEEQVSRVDRVKRVTSTTRQGVSIVQVSFEDDVSAAEFSRLSQQVRAEFGQVKLPDGTLDPYTDDFTSSDFMPMVTVVVRGEADQEAINRAGRDLRRRFLEIPGVSKAEIVGGRSREVRVEADRDKLEAFGVSLEEVANAIKYHNLTVPGGTLNIGSRAYLLQTLGEVTDPRQLDSIIVRRRPGRGSVSVSDVAAVRSTMGESPYDVRFNGERAVTLMVTKKSRASSIAIVRQIRKAVEQGRAAMPAGVTVDYFNDTSAIIHEVVSVLGVNAVEGLFIVLLTLWPFFGWRESLITCLRIPVVFAITFLFMEWYGESLNGNSLFALVMVLGMIVSNAIIIIENCYRHRQLGLSMHDAAIAGTSEVVSPVLSSTLTTVASFAPLMLMPGIIGRFMYIIPLAVSLALVASIVDALLFVPAQYASWGTAGTNLNRGIIARWRDAYGQLVAWVYRRRRRTLAITGLVIAACGGLVFTIRQDLFRGEDYTMFYIDLAMPIGTPRRVTDQVAARFEQRLLPLVGKGEVASVTVASGFSRRQREWLTQSNVAQLTVDVAERTEGRRRPLRAIMADVRRLCADIPGAESVSFSMESTGPPQDKPITFRIQGEDFDEMAAVADDYVRMLSEYPGVLYNAGHNYEAGNPQLVVKVNEARAAELGLNVGLIGLYLRESFEGVRATTIFDRDEELRVLVRLAGRDSVSIEDVMQMQIPAPSGPPSGASSAGPPGKSGSSSGQAAAAGPPSMETRWVPFSAVCTLERSSGLAAIKRWGGRREITVSADAFDSDQRRMRPIMQQVKQAFEQKYQPAYPQLSLRTGGDWAEFGTVMRDMLRLFMIGFFVIYIILVAQFKSLVQPLVIGNCLLFGAAGCILYMVVSGTPMSLVVVYAAVGLAGVCVNDAIVMMSFINRLRRDGMPTEQAVVEGARIRLRPIILTSVTTIVGLLPTAVGLGGWSPVWSPMASTMMYGMIVSTIGTLIVIPCLYGVTNDMSEKLGFRMKLEGE